MSSEIALPGGSSRDVMELREWRTWGGVSGTAWVNNECPGKSRRGKVENYTTLRCCTSNLVEGLENGIDRTVSALIVNILDV